MSAASTPSAMMAAATQPSSHAAHDASVGRRLVEAGVLLVLTADVPTYRNQLVSAAKGLRHSNPTLPLHAFALGLRTAMGPDPALLPLG